MDNKSNDNEKMRTTELEIVVSTENTDVLLL